LLDSLLQEKQGLPVIYTPVSDLSYQAES